MLSVENLTCHRSGRVVIDSVDFHVASREIVALVGGADAGKTTVLECMLGMHPRTDGRICVADIDPAFAPHAAASLLAFCPAQLAFPSGARLFEHVLKTCLSYGRRIPENVVRATLERGGVCASWHHGRIADCPSATQRKLGLVLAALKNVDAILLDDPTRDLEADDIDTLVLNLRGLRRGGVAILIATRDMAFARRVATRIVGLERAMVVESFNPNAPRCACETNAYLAELVA